MENLHLFLHSTSFVLSIFIRSSAFTTFKTISFNGSESGRWMRVCNAIGVLWQIRWIWVLSVISFIRYIDVVHGLYKLLNVLVFSIVWIGLLRQITLLLFNIFATWQYRIRWYRMPVFQRIVPIHLIVCIIMCVMCAQCASILAHLPCVFVFVRIIIYMYAFLTKYLWQRARQRPQSENAMCPFIVSQRWNRAIMWIKMD